MVFSIHASPPVFALLIGSLSGNEGDSNLLCKKALKTNINLLRLKFRIQEGEVSYFTVVSADINSALQAHA